MKKIDDFKFLNMVALSSGDCSTQNIRHSKYTLI